MNRNNSGKKLSATAPDSLEMADKVSSPVIRHLGLIKAMAIIMGLLIIAALSIIIVTIYGRLNSGNAAKAILENELVIPTDSHVVSASLGEKGQIILLIMDETGQEIWHLDRAGKVQRKTLIIRTQ